MNVSQSRLIDMLRGHDLSAWSHAELTTACVKLKIKARGSRRELLFRIWCLMYVDEKRRNKSTKHLDVEAASGRETGGSQRSSHP